ncbi:LysR family transcriptional regulator [Pseudomonas aeruginosa]|uniref:LysR family transcriptional regulator n=2 Tax=Gammaproteobacteria TaxID=1236 RepID=UPI00398389B2
MRQAYFCDLLSKGGLTEEVSVRRVGQRTMELNQVSYFINLAETLNFTAAARLSGVSQPSLTRAIRRLEDELGGPLIYRDGKNSRLTGLGHDVEAEFRRMVVAMKSVRNHSEHWAMGGTACWMSPSRPPSDQRNLRHSSRAHWRRCHPSKSSCTRSSRTRTHRRCFQENTTRASCRVKQDRNASWMVSVSPTHLLSSRIFR